MLFCIKLCMFVSTGRLFRRFIRSKLIFARRSSDAFMFWMEVSVLSLFHDTMIIVMLLFAYKGMGTMVQKYPLTEADFRGERFKDHPKVNFFSCFILIFCFCQIQNSICFFYCLSSHCFYNFMADSSLRTGSEGQQ